MLPPFKDKFTAYLVVSSLSVSAVFHFLTSKISHVHDILRKQILVWDIVNNIKGDYHLLSRHRLGLPTLIYFLSRSVDTT